MSKQLGLYSSSSQKVSLTVHSKGLTVSKEDFNPSPGCTMRCWYPFGIGWWPRWENTLLSGGMGRPIKVAYRTNLNWKYVGVMINLSPDSESQARWKRGLIKIAR
jgi:hypothetical protein